MAWRMVAKKGNTVSRSGAHKRKVLDKRAKRLRADGWKVWIYEVK